jgi:transposase
LRKYPECMIWKITGRYLIRNVRNIVDRCKTNQSDVYVNMRNHPYKVVDFYFVGFNLGAYEKLFSKNLEMYEGLQDGELILRHYLDSASLPTLNVVRRLPVTPRLVGVRGFDGNRYGGWKDAIKFYIRLVSCKVAPFFWI